MADFVADFLYICNLNKLLHYMNVDNLEIRTNPFKKSPARKKDGLHQVKIRVFIGSNDFGKFRNKITLEVNVIDDSKNASTCIFNRI